MAAGQQALVTARKEFDQQVVAFGLKVRDESSSTMDTPDHPFPKHPGLSDVVESNTSTYPQQHMPFYRRRDGIIIIILIIIIVIGAIVGGALGGSAALTAQRDRDVITTAAAIPTQFIATAAATPTQVSITTVTTSTVTASTVTTSTVTASTVTTSTMTTSTATTSTATTSTVTTSTMVTTISAPSPSPSNCVWEGTAPFCDGKCHTGFTQMKEDNCGSGACCSTGFKVYCCQQ